MAGIGFRISRLLRSEDLYSKLGGIFASVLVSCGPWLCTVLAIAGISFLSPASENPLDKQVFRIIINYTYVGSLIGFSFMEMSATRYVADAIYLHQERVIPTMYSWLVAFVLAVAFLSGGVFYTMAGLDWRIVVAAASLLAIVSSIWCSMIFLSACKDYVHISLSFIFGMSLSVGAAWLLAAKYKMGVVGQLGGFLSGQAYILAALTYRIFRDFGTGFLAPRDFLSHWRRNHRYMWVGVFYSFAIWVDKFVFWLNPSTSERVIPLFYKSPAYESGIFLAYLFVVPSMSYFLVQMETRFYMAYRGYFSLIDNRAPLSLIEQGRVEMVNVVRSNIGGLVLFQSVVSVPAVLLARQMMDIAGLPLIFTTVFRYAVIASTLHVFALFANILLLYFDLPNRVVRNYATFFVLNGVLAVVTARMDSRYHGLGYAIAAFVVLFVSVLELRSVLARLNFLVFMKQPLAKPSHLPLVLENVSLAVKAGT